MFIFLYVKSCVVKVFLLFILNKDIDFLILNIIRDIYICSRY